MLYLTLGIVLFALAIWAAWIEPRRCVVRRHDVVVEHLNAPVKVVMIADIQPNEFHWSGARLTRYFKDISAQEAPDLVFWLGDYYNAPTDVTKTLVDNSPQLGKILTRYLPPMNDIAQAMGHLHGKAGSFAVLGNHDWAWSGDETRAALEAQNIRVLVDDVAVVEAVPGAPLQILGYEDVSSGRQPDYARMHGLMDASLPQIALSHSPDSFVDADDGPPLMLSGHTHGGQVRLPLIGPLLLPIDNKQFDRGWFTDRNRRLFVSSGLGTSLPPFRFLCPPEIVVLSLIPGKTGQGHAND